MPINHSIKLPGLVNADKTSADSSSTNNFQHYKKLPTGNYLAKVKSIKDDQSKNGNEQIIITLSVHVDKNTRLELSIPESDEVIVRKYITYTPNNARSYEYKIRRFLRGVGANVIADSVELSPELVNRIESEEKRLGIELVHRSDNTQYPVEITDFIHESELAQPPKPQRTAEPTIVSASPQFNKVPPVTSPATNTTAVNSDVDNFQFSDDETTNIVKPSQTFTDNTLGF